MTVAATDINNNEAGFSNSVAASMSGLPASTSCRPGSAAGRGRSQERRWRRRTSPARARSSLEPPAREAGLVERMIKSDRVQPGTQSKDGDAIELLNVRNF